MTSSGYARVSRSFVLPLATSSLLMMRVMPPPSGIQTSMASLQVIRLDRHHGTPYAKNVGLEHTDTPYIWFLDSDTEIVNPYMLAYGYQMLEQHQSLGIIGGEFRIGPTGERGMYSVTSRWTGAGKPCYLDARLPLLVFNDAIPTSNFMIRTELLRRIHGFVDIMYHGEDLLASLMVRRLGYTNASSTEFAVVHYRSSSGRNAPEHKTEHIFAGRAFVYGALRNTNVFLYLISLFVTLVMEAVHNHAQHRVADRYGAGVSSVTRNPDQRSFVSKLRSILCLDNKSFLLAGRRYAESIQ